MPYEYQDTALSPYKTVGRQGNGVEDIVLHWWGNPTKYRSPDAHSGVVDYFLRYDAERAKTGGTSAHCVVSAGKVTQTVHDEDTAHHAGNWAENLKSKGYELKPVDGLTPRDEVIAIIETVAESIARDWHIHPETDGKPLRFHKEFKGTDCPGNWTALDGIIFARAEELFPYIDVDNPGKLKGTPPPFDHFIPDLPIPETGAKMFSPAQGYIPNGGRYGDKRAGGPHSGLDITCPVGTNVYAAFGGVVEKVGTNIVAGRTGIGLLVRNPDGERQYYGHLSQVLVKVGQTVKAGQHIAESGATGNVTGPHLHFEIWNKNGKTRNPLIDFEYFGVTPGSGPKVDSALVEANKAIQRKLAALPRPSTGKPYYEGLIDGDPGPMTDKAIENFQRDNGLYPDTIWGPVTEAKYQEVTAPKPKPTPAPAPAPAPAPKPKPVPVPSEPDPDPIPSPPLPDVEKEPITNEELQALFRAAVSGGIQDALEGATFKVSLKR